MLVNSERYPLQEIVIKDLFLANKLVIVLLLAIVVSAIGTVWLTHQTRLLVAEKGELIFQKQALENEYLNLQLEETTMGDKVKIEARAVALGMQPISSQQEIIIEQ
ncbi:MAG: cell division protein FtsL [Lonepinella koalarum]|nr:cell division protein FtsL [Lonepinella koalarum]